MKDIRNFIAIPQDEYGNVCFTNGDWRIIKAEVNDGQLIILEPKNFPWPTLDYNPNVWKETKHEAQELTEEQWEEIVGWGDNKTISLQEFHKYIKDLHGREI